MTSVLFIIFICALFNKCGDTHPPHYLEKYKRRKKRPIENNADKCYGWLESHIQLDLEVNNDIKVKILNR